MSTKTSTKSVSVEELNELCQTENNIDLIDVRTPKEFREVHSSFARNLPLDSLDPRTVISGHSNVDQPLYFICRSGARAAKACEAFVAAGFTNVVNVAGGTDAWDAAELSVERGKKAISLERQVRLAAGLLVFLGSLLGYFIHDYWIALPAFVGAGLIFAGITDTCGMAMLLARMPWNQLKESDM